MIQIFSGSPNQDGPYYRSPKYRMTTQKSRGRLKSFSLLPTLVLIVSVNSLGTFHHGLVLKNSLSGLCYREKLKQWSKRRREGLAPVQYSSEDRASEPINVDEINKAEKKFANSSNV